MRYVCVGGGGVANGLCPNAGYCAAALSECCVAHSAERAILPQLHPTQPLRLYQCNILYILNTVGGQLLGHKYAHALVELPTSSRNYTQWLYVVVCLYIWCSVQFNTHRHDLCVKMYRFELSSESHLLRPFGEL